MALGRADPVMGRDSILNLGVGDMARRIVHWDEADAYTGWRHRLAWLRRAGGVKKVKRRTHKRERQEGKRDTASWDD